MAVTDAAAKRRTPEHCITWLTYGGNKFAQDMKKPEYLRAENPFLICADVMTGLVLALQQVKDYENAFNMLPENVRDLVESALKGRATYTLTGPGRA